MRFSQADPSLWHGGDWNPEQWGANPAIIDQDLDAMHRAGINTVTLGVFAWGVLEPAPGDYRLDWLGKIFDRLEHERIQAILATPSGGVPAWLAACHPEVLRVNRDGQRHPWTWRHHHCPSSPALRDAVAAIDSRLAAAFGNHPALRLWHIGNEFGGQCHCPLCIAAFQTALRQQHHSLAELDAAWWNTFWSHQPGAWDHIRNDDTSNDGQQFAWRRFVSDLHIDFIRHEIAAVRTQSENRPVTTNLMGLHPTINLHRLAPHLDIISTDSYPAWGGDGDVTQAAVEAALDYDLCRSLGSGAPFLLMESTPSSTNRAPYPQLKRPGVHRLQMLQAVAHGARGTLLFQIRAGRGGREKFHGAVLANGCEPGTSRVFAEVAAWGAELPRLTDIAEARITAPVALVVDWDSWWALEAASGPFGGDDPQLKGYQATIAAWYQAVWRRSLAVDVVAPEADLTPYRVVLAPLAFALTQATVARWAQFVSTGGIVLTGYGSGYVDADGLCHLGPRPGAGLGALLGLYHHELDAPPATAGQSLCLTDGSHYPVWDCAELIQCDPETAVLATYDHSFYAGTPAWTRRSHHAGAAHHLACRCSQAGLERVIDAVLAEADLVSAGSAPRTSIMHCSRGGYRFTFDFSAGHDRRHAARVEPDTLPVTMSLSSRPAITPSTYHESPLHGAVGPETWTGIITSAEAGRTLTEPADK